MRTSCDCPVGTSALSRDEPPPGCGNGRSNFWLRGAWRVRGHEVLSWRGHRIHVSDAGEGEPLLLVSGLGCNADMWAPFVQEFAGRRIIRFDAPGTGRSSTPLFPVSVAALAELAAAVLDL